MNNRDEIIHRLGLIAFIAMVIALGYVTYAAYEEAARACAEQPQ